MYRAAKCGPRMFNFIGVSTQVLRDRLMVDASNIVRIAKGSDGSCMLLIPDAKNNQVWAGYYAWLGGKLGFTEYTILHTCDRESNKEKLLENIRKRKVSTKYNDLDLTTSSSEPSDEPSRHYELRSVKGQFQQAGRKCFSFPSSVTKPKLKIKLKLPSSKYSSQNVSPLSPAVQFASRSGIVSIRTPPRLQSPLAWPLTPSTPSSSNTVRFRFLVATKSFGAIPKLLDLSLTPEAFFDEAFGAFAIVGNPPPASRMAGVKVVITPSERPIFVPWKNKESFYEMINIVREKAAGRTAKLDVEVNCVQKRR